MKNFAIVLIGIFVSFTLGAQDMSDTQWSILTKKTADWCPHCGSWGWDFYHDAIDRLENENVIVWAVHKSGGLSNSLTTAISDNLPGGGQPVFYLGEDNLGVTSSNTSEKLDELLDFVPAINSFDPSEIVGTEVSIKDTKVKIKRKVGFKTDRTISDNLYMASYIVQDDLVASQASQGDNAHHTNVLLGSITGKTFGEPIPNGSYSNGDEYEFNEIEMDLSNWKFPTSDVSIVSIIWTLDNGRFYFINANKQSLSSGTSSTKDLYAEEDLDIVRITQDNITIEWKGPAIDNATLQLSDQSGRIINNQMTSLTTASQYTIERGSDVPGVYFVTLTDGKSVISKKLFLY